MLKKTTNPTRKSNKSRAAAPQEVTKDDSSLHKICPIEPAFSYRSDAVNPPNDKITRIKPSKTFVWANFHFDLVKLRPDKTKIIGAKIFIQPKRFVKNSLQKDKISELVAKATIDKTAKVKATSEPIAVIVLCRNLSLGNL